MSIAEREMTKREKMLISILGIIIGCIMLLGFLMKLPSFFISEETTVRETVLNGIQEKFNIIPEEFSITKVEDNRYEGIIRLNKEDWNIEIGIFGKLVQWKLKKRSGK